MIAIRSVIPVANPNSERCLQIEPIEPNMIAHIMTLYLQKKISLETFTILANSSNIFPYWSEKVVDRIVARDIIRLSRKYMPFLEINQKKYKDIIRDRFF